jgi:endonuclease III
MKNATTYQKKVRKLLSGVRDGKGDNLFAEDSVRGLLRAVLLADVSDKAAEKAEHALSREFVDYNELRVAPAKDIVDVIGKDYPGGREKAEMLTSALNAIFDRTGTLSMEYLAKLPKRELRRHLREIGLDGHASAYVAIAYGAHAVPVDQSLADLLEMQQCVEPGSSRDDVEGFLEHLIPQKQAAAAAKFFRKLVETTAKPLEKFRQSKAEEAARVAAEARAKAEAAEKARLDREKKLAEKKAAAEARKAEVASKKAQREAAAKALAHAKAKARAQKAKPKPRKASKK